MIERILILAGDTDDNIGDLAIVTALCDHLRIRHPAVDIALVTSRPERDQGRLNIRPIRRGLSGLFRLLREANRADLVICGGGGLFQDDDSLIKMPYWALRLSLIRLVSKKIIGVSIGAGPLKYGISRMFARLALSNIEPITVRDMDAKVLLSELTSRPIGVVPDTAFILKPAAEDEARQLLLRNNVPMNGRPLLGVSVRRLFHTNSNVLPYKLIHKAGFGRNRGRDKMIAFVIQIARALDVVVAKTGAHIVFLPTYKVDHENDLAVCSTVADAMHSSSHSTIGIDDPKLYQTVTSQLSTMLCGRMHPAIMAASQGTPIVGLAYNQKFRGTFELLGFEDRCLTIQDFVGGDNSSLLSQMLVDSISTPEKFKPDTTAIAQTTRQFLTHIVSSNEQLAPNARKLESEQ